MIRTPWLLIDVHDSHTWVEIDVHRLTEQERRGKVEPMFCPECDLCIVLSRLEAKAFIKDIQEVIE